MVFMNVPPVRQVLRVRFVTTHDATDESYMSRATRKHLQIINTMFVHICKCLPFASLIYASSVASCFVIKCNLTTCRTIAISFESGPLSPSDAPPSNFSTTSIASSTYAGPEDETLQPAPMEGASMDVLDRLLADSQDAGEPADEDAVDDGLATPIVTPCPDDAAFAELFDEDEDGAAHVDAEVDDEDVASDMMSSASGLPDI